MFWLCDPGGHEPCRVASLRTLRRRHVRPVGPRVGPRVGTAPGGGPSRVLSASWRVARVVLKKHGRSASRGRGHAHDLQDLRGAPRCRLRLVAPGRASPRLSGQHAAVVHVARGRRRQHGCPAHISLFVEVLSRGMLEVACAYQHRGPTIESVPAAPRTPCQPLPLAAPGSPAPTIRCSCTRVISAVMSIASISASRLPPTTPSVMFSCLCTPHSGCFAFRRPHSPPRMPPHPTSFRCRWHAGQLRVCWSRLGGAVANVLCRLLALVCRAWRRFLARSPHLRRAAPSSPQQRPHPRGPSRASAMGDVRPAREVLIGGAQPPRADAAAPQSAAQRRSRCDGGVIHIYH